MFSVFTCIQTDPKLAILKLQNRYVSDIMKPKTERTRERNRSLVWFFKPTKPEILFLQETVPTAVKPSGCRNCAQVYRFLSLNFFFFFSKKAMVVRTQKPKLPLFCRLCLFGERLTRGLEID